MFLIFVAAVVAAWFYFAPAAFQLPFAQEVIAAIVIVAILYILKAFSAVQRARPEAPTTVAPPRRQETREYLLPMPDESVYIAGVSDPEAHPDLPRNAWKKSPEYLQYRSEIAQYGTEEAVRRLYSRKS